MNRRNVLARPLPRFLTAGILVPVLSLVSSRASEPTTRGAAATTQADSQTISDAKNALVEGRYKDARELFLKAAAADPQSAPLHGAGIACIYLQDKKQADSLLQSALQLSPSPDRAELQLGSRRYEYGGLPPRRADSSRLSVCVPNSLDEPLLDALGVTLQETGEKNTSSRFR